MISYDTRTRRMVDTENGDYLLSQIYDRDEYEWSFMLYDQYDQPLLGSVVKVNNIDEFGNSGGATLSRCTLLKTWIPSGRPEPPIYFNEAHPLISRLAAFLEARLYAHGTKTPYPRFEFIDARNNTQRAEAFGWAESYQQDAQAPQKSKVEGKQIFLGLLLTLGLHLTQLLLLPLTRTSNVDSNNKFALILLCFGFTQLLYMLPAIYLSRRNRGLMIGLIIGTAITFMLGLPTAAFAVICGSILKL